MINIKMIKHVSLFSLFFLAITLQSQSTEELLSLDKDFIESLPKSVQDDLKSEMESSDVKNKNLQYRPSTEISKYETIKNWQRFQKDQLILKESERYGLRLFNTMQSSFMPLNEPNFGSNYTVDYGDSINIDLFGTQNDSYTVDVKRDGTVLLEEIGSISVAGLNFDQVTNLIKKRYQSAFIGVEVVVALSKIRDINVLITGNIDFPGMYTLSGNSNILQALNIVGGINEKGSLRNIVLKRKNYDDEVVDLYQALLFGDIESIPFLMSGDSIHISKAKNLVRAGHGFSNTAIFELLEEETIKDLITYAGGLNRESKNEKLKLVRYENGKFTSFEVESNNFLNFKVKNLDSVYADQEVMGTVSITGNVKYPGKYSISSSDRLLDIINRSGGYKDSAYPFGGSLYRESAKELENIFAEKSYNNLITFIASNPAVLPTGGGTQGLSYILTELKDYKATGRVIVEFNESKLLDNIQDNIYLNDGDEIHIPTYTSNVYVFGEVGNPGSVIFQDGISMQEYINMSGGLTRYSSNDSIFIVSPNGETKKVHISGLKKYLGQNIDVYPGSLIYVPRHVAKIEGINYLATLAPIFSSLALSVASINSINN
jgi:protein involved in polysaccharide export with SLBB domain